MKLDLSEIIARNAAFTPNKAALRFDGDVLSYAAFVERIDGAAAALRSDLGVRRGDRVAVLALNHPDTLVLFYACCRLGAMLLPLNWRLAAAELAYIVSDAKPKVAFIAADFADTIPALRAASPETKILPYAGSDGLPGLIEASSGDGRGIAATPADIAMLMYTSGTTGRPKGAMLRQEAILWNAVQSHHMHAMTPDDHVLTVLPLFHVGSLNIQTTPALHIGATVTIHQKFTPGETLAAIEKDRATLLVLVPSTIRAVIGHEAWRNTDLGSLRCVTTGSEQVHPAVVDAFASRGVPVLQVYGATETTPIAIYTRLGGDMTRGTSTGLPGIACEARIASADGAELAHGAVGEIEVRGPNVLAGYWNNDKATRDALRDNGWYRTGDIGSRDNDGYFTVHDRRTNMIISGGENIYPAEVERVLAEHPAVALCAVVGAPDPKWQEVPVAYVVTRPGVEASADALIAHVAASLAKYKVPKRLEFVDALPANALGKVQHFALRAQQAEKAAQAR